MCVNYYLENMKDYIVNNRRTEKLEKTLEKPKLGSKANQRVDTNAMVKLP